MSCLPGRWWCIGRSPPPCVYKRTGNIDPTLARYWVDVSFLLGWRLIKAGYQVPRELVMSLRDGVLMLAQRLRCWPHIWARLMQYITRQTNRYFIDRKKSHYRLICHSNKRDICTCIYKSVSLLKSYMTIYMLWQTTKIMLSGIAIIKTGYFGNINDYFLK